MSVFWLHRAIILAGICATISGKQTPVSTTRTPADTILINGRILTVDPADSIAEALAIRNGRILEVGTQSSVMRHAGPQTHTIDLHGLTATPGLIDSHMHLSEVGAVYSTDLGSAKSVNDVLRAVQAQAAKGKPGEWVLGGGWDEGKLQEHRYVYASDLDRILPDRPVWLVHTTGHYGVANSFALRMAQITAATKNPDAGTIDRDQEGNPTGVLKEAAAMRLVASLIPPYTQEQLRDGYLTTIAGLHKEGMTAVKDPDINPSQWEAYRTLREQNKLTLHVFVLWHGGTQVAETQQVIQRISDLRNASAGADDLLISGGVKLFMDGSGGARTAWLYQDWSKNFSGTDVGNRGYPLTNPETYRQQVKLIHNAGIHIGTHAIGDRAIDWVVDTYAQVLKDKPTKGLRHSIIHANIPTDHALSVMTDLQKKYDAGYPEAQGEFMWWLGDTYAGNFGPARDLRLKPFRTYLDRGIRWAGGSDYPVTPYPARYGMWASLQRETLNGTYGPEPFGMKEAVDIHAVLHSYTIWAARQLFLDGSIGSLETGKDADVAVWDRDPYRVPTSEIKDMRCVLTIFKGQSVYRDEQSPVTLQ